MRRERLAKAQAAMKKHGLAACLLFRPDNIRYTTAMKGVGFAGQLRYVLCFAEHDPIVYEHGSTLVHHKVHCPWIKPENWRCAYSWLMGVGGPTVSREVAKVWAQGILSDLKEKGLAKEELGVDTVDELGRQALNEAGITVVSAGPAMTEARRIKTQDEIYCHKMAATFASMAYYHVAKILRPGMRETDIRAAATAVMIQAGGETTTDVPRVRSGPNSFEDYAGATTDRILEAGDMLYMNICGAIAHMGYLTCYYRDFCVGKKPTDKQKDWHKRVYDRIHAVLGAIRPGATTAEAAKYFPPAGSWGYDSEWWILTKEIGHGLGLSLYEEPVINRLWSINHPQVFEEGMVIAVECRDGEPFVGGSRLEEMAVVTRTGTEVITLVPADEIISPGTFG
jgi:Xaa-Pro dipeptidase